MRRVEIQIRLGLQIGFQVVQDARLAGLQNLLEAAAGEALRIADVDLDRAQFGPRPIGRYLRAVLRQERAADAVVGNDAGEAVENPVQRILDADPLLDRFDYVEEMADFAFAPVQAIGKQSQFVAEPGQRIVVGGIERRHGLAAPQLFDPGRVAVHSVPQRDAIVDRLGHECLCRLKRRAISVANPLIISQCGPLRRLCFQPCGGMSPAAQPAFTDARKSEVRLARIAARMSAISPS